MNLTLSDYRKIAEIIDLIYSIPDYEAMLRAVCRSLEKLVGFSSANIRPLDSQTAKYIWPDNILPCSHYVVTPPKRIWPDAINHNYDSDAANISIRYFQRYVKIDPLITKWDGQFNSSRQNTELISAVSLADSELGRDILAPASIFYMMMSVFGSQGDTVGSLGLHRQRQDRPFGEREKTIVDIVSTHISRALHNMYVMSAIAPLPGVGIITIEGDRFVSYQNAEAKRILDGMPVTSVPDPGFSSAPMFFRSRAGMYMVRTVKAWGKLGKTILLEPVPPEHNIRSKLAGFGLTRSQQDVAVLVIRGLSNQEIAGNLFITEQTVKDHLYDIFQKLQIKRRSELAVKVLGL